MKILFNNKIVMAVIFLTFFSTNSFAYSNQELTIRDDSVIKIVKTKIGYSAYTTVTKSPDMVNRLRLMLSDQNTKLPK